MKCPSCDYEASQAQFGEPLRCPDCGAFYEKALELKLKATAAQAAPAIAPQSRSARGMVPCRGCKASISKHAAACPHCGATQKKKTSLFTWIMAVLAGLWLMGFLASSNLDKTGPTATVSAPVVSPLAQAKADTVLENFDWKKSAGGALMSADFTIRNNGAVAVKDIEIECIHFGPSGTKIDSNKRTLYEIVGAGQARTFKDFDMGFIHSQVEKTSCSIKSISI